MDTLRKILFIVLVICGTTAFNPNRSFSQCAMCKATVESNMKNKNIGGINESTNGNNIGMGLNKGILYLLTIPYILGAVGFGIWYKHKKHYRHS